MNRRFSIPKLDLASYRSFPASLRRSRRRLVIGVWSAMLALNAVYVTYLLLGTVFGRFPHAVDWVFSFLVEETSVMLCAALCWLRARYAQTERLAWGVLGAGLAIYTCGDSYWILSGLSNDLNPPLLSPADIGYTLGTLLIVVAVVLLARGSVARFVAGQWLDSAAATLAVLATACTALLSPIVASNSGANLERPSSISSTRRSTRSCSRARSR